MYLNSPLIVPSSASSILTSAIKTNFLSLFTNNKIINENPDTSIGYNVVINLARVSNKSKADFTFYASNNPKDPNVKYVDRYLDLHKTHSLTYHTIINEVDKTIKEDNIPFTPIRYPVKSEKILILIYLLVLISIL